MIRGTGIGGIEGDQTMTDVVLGHIFEAFHAFGALFGVVLELVVFDPPAEQFLDAI